MGHYVRGEYVIDKNGLGSYKMHYRNWDIQVKFEKLSEYAITPTQATEGSAGFDLYAIDDATIGPGETVVIDTGLKFEIPDGYFMYISSKSGLARNHGLLVLNSPALIDSDYRGEVSIILHKVNNVVIPDMDGQSYYVRKGDKIAQFIILPYPKVSLVEGKVDVNTERGEGGFGSTGR